jgi:hypothetical protein
MNWLVIDAYTALVSGIFTIFMGFFVFLKSPKKKLNIIYLLFSISMADWLLSGFMFHSSKTEVEAIFWDRMIYMGVSFLPAYLTHMGFIFTNRDKKERGLIRFGYLTSFIFAFLTQNNNFVDGTYNYSWGMHSQAKIFHNLLVVFFLAFAAIFFWKMYKFLKTPGKKNDEQMQQMKYFLIFNGFLFSGSYAFLAAYGIDLNPFGTYILEFSSLLILAFAITKYHLFETKVLLTEVLVGAMAVVLLILPFLMPSALLITISVVVFVLFCFVGYLLVKLTTKEVKAKENFENMVGERTKELAERNKELEKFYKLTIGRELRMAELKEKIKELGNKQH